MFSGNAAWSLKEKNEIKLACKLLKKTHNQTSWVFVVWVFFKPWILNTYKYLFVMKSSSMMHKNKHKYLQLLHPGQSEMLMPEGSR